MFSISRSTAALAICCGLIASKSADQEQQFPKYIKVDRSSLTIHAKDKGLGDVTVYKWAGVMPDTVTDTLRFLARRGIQFSNEKILNRCRCTELTTAIAVHRDSLGLDVTQEMQDHWRDSLEQILPAISYAGLDLLYDQKMRFDSTCTDGRAPYALRDIIEPDHWYLFDIWGNDAGPHAVSSIWFIAFYLDDNSTVQHWVNSKKTYPAYGGSTKNL